MRPLLFFFIEEIRKVENLFMIEFVDYTGCYPILCSGTLIIKVDKKEYQLNGVLCSGGTCGFDDEWNGVVTTGPWEVHDLPKELEPYHDEIEKLVNDNIEYGCCSGCCGGCL